MADMEEIEEGKLKKRKVGINSVVEKVKEASRQWPHGIQWGF